MQAQDNDIDEEGFHLFPWNGHPCIHKHLKVDIKKRLVSCKVKATKPIIKKVKEDLTMLYELWYMRMIHKWASHESRYIHDHTYVNVHVADVIRERSTHLKHFPESACYGTNMTRWLSNTPAWWHKNHKKDSEVVKPAHRCPLSEAHLHRVLEFGSGASLPPVKLKCLFSSEIHKEDLAAQEEDEPSPYLDKVMAEVRAEQSVEAARALREESRD